MNRFGGVLALLAFGLVSAPGVAALDACREIASPEERLACYDAAVAQEPEQITDRATGADTPAAQPRERSRERNRRTLLENNDVLDVAIEQIGTDAYGRLVVTLANGETWRQVDDRRTTLRVADRVNVKESTFGGWHMRDVGANKRSIQVTPIEP